MFISNSAVETVEAGARLARELKAGDVLALAGELGAGKTQFVKGIARGLGFPGAVTSPTFTLVHEYAGGRLPLYHFDWFRLDNADGLAAIGFDEYVFGNGVSVIEWADKFPEMLPQHRRWITFALADKCIRQIDFGAAPVSSPSGRTPRRGEDP